MKLILERNDQRSSGIFGVLSDEAGNLLAVTLEHAYFSSETWLPKIPPGSYQCVRGLHRLHGMAEPFSTFEITGVTGHSNLLFHWGNYNRDSDGCVLLGRERYGSIISHSKDTFAEFMKLLENESSFQLEVI